MAVTSIGGHKNGQNLKKSPVLQSKMANKNRHKIVAVFVGRFGLFFLNFFVISPCFSLFPAAS